MTLSPASGDGVEITTDQEQGRCYYCLMCVCGWFMTSSGHLVQTLYCIKWAQAIIHGKAQLCLETRLQSQSLRSPSPQDDIFTTTLRVQAWWRMTGHCVLACPGIIVWIRLRSINFKGSRALALCGMLKTLIWLLIRMGLVCGEADWYKDIMMRQSRLIISTITITPHGAILFGFVSISCLDKSKCNFIPPSFTHDCCNLIIKAAQINILLLQDKFACRGLILTKSPCLCLFLAISRSPIMTNAPKCYPHSNVSPWSLVMINIAKSEARSPAIRHRAYWCRLA